MLSGLVCFILSRRSSCLHEALQGVSTPQCLKVAMINVYIIACLKHITAKEGVTLSYRSRSEEARRNNAISKQKQRLKSVSDPD